MSNLERFGAYAAAFEKTFESDDFSLLEPYFTEDAVYETRSGDLGAVSEGRDAAFAALKASLDGMDRRFATRELALLEGPIEREDGSVWFRWSARYTRPGLPELKIAGEETALFRDGRIHRLVDVFSDASARAATAYMAEHAAVLGQDL